MMAYKWLAAVKEAAKRYFPDKPTNTQIIRRTRVKIRIEIGEDIFADLFFREETERCDYTLIVAGKRYYGLDNLGGWHEHPIGTPESHNPINQPTPGEAISRLRKAVDELNR